MLNFSLITPEREVITQEVYEVILPTQDGEIAILPHHLPIISLLKAGVISLRLKKEDKDTQLEHLAVKGGFLEMDGNNIKVMADIAYKASEVSEIEANEARKKALELKEKATDKVSLADATSALEHSLIQLKLVTLRKRKHQSQ